MPTYEYECEDGHRFTVNQRITDKPLRLCPEQTERVFRCDAPVKRLLFPVTAKLLGGGWAKDGYGGSK